MVRVNEAAMKSTPRLMPNNKSPLSFSDRNGIEIWVFGRFTPLCSPSSPLFCTSQTTSSPLISITFKPIKPSSNKTVAPTFKSFAKLGYVTPTLVLLPTNLLSEVKVILSPVTKETSSPFSKSQVLISGPFVSNRTAKTLPVSCMIALMFVIRPPCSSKSPCEKFRRITFMPEFSRVSIISRFSDLGPIVQTILVFFIFRLS